MTCPVHTERRLRAARALAGELRDAGFRADVRPVDGRPGLVVTQSDGARLAFTVVEIGAVPVAVLAEADRPATASRCSARRLSAQLALAAVAAVVMLLTALVGGTP